MARGLPKSTKEIRPVTTMVNTDEMLVNVQIGGRWYTARIALLDFKELLTDVIESNRCIRPDPACETLRIVTGAGIADTLNVYEPMARGFLLDELENANQSLFFNGSIDGLTNTPMPFLLSIDLPILQSVGGSLICSQCPALASFFAPLLTSVLGDVLVAGNPNLGSLDLDALVTVGGDLQLDGNLSTTANFPVLETIGGDATFSAVSAIDLSSLTSLGGNFSAINGSLDVDNVNDLLVKLDSLGLVGRTIALQGGTSAAPTGAGATAKANLISDGNTVTTN